MDAFHIIHGKNLSTDKYDYALDIINSYYVIFDIVNSSDESINLDYLFKDRIVGSIYRSIFMNNITFKERKCFLIKLKEFEKDIGFKTGLNDKITDILNKLILADHIRTATVFAINLNYIHNNKSIVKLYRKLFNQ